MREGRREGQRLHAEHDKHSSKQCLDKMTKYHGKK